MFDLDMNRVFPGDNNGAITEYLAAGIIDDIIGSDMCLDIHSSNIFVKEMPQVRLNDDNEEKLLPYAKLLNADFVWIYSSITVLEATLAYSLNNMGVPTLVVEMGVGHRINNAYCHQLIDGIFNMLIHMGIWEDEAPQVKQPIISTEGEVSIINAALNKIIQIHFSKSLIGCLLVDLHAKHAQKKIRQPGSQLRNRI